MRPEPAAAFPTTLQPARPPSLDARRARVAAALRAVRDEPPAVDAVAALAAAVRRLAERVERVEDKVDLFRRDDDAPLSWPVPVTDDNHLEVPPFEVSRGDSPAFDVLLGPSRPSTRPA